MKWVILKIKENSMFLMLLGLVVFSYLLLHDLVGGTLFLHESLDSYTIQALAWRKGEVFLANGQDYPWLELAIYNGRYFVSFPPIPTIFMLPLTVFFGEETPNTLMVAIYTLAAFIGSYHACLALRMKHYYACFWAVFATFACNLLEISTNGGVWLQAQTLNFAFLIWAVDCILRDRWVICCIFLVLAVGCRPLSAIYIPVALILFLLKESNNSSGVKTKRQLGKLLGSLTVIAVGAAGYMWYNYIRFDNVFEFGHNYLPEFTSSDAGQFSLRYFSNNFYNIMCRPIRFLPNGKLEFPLYNGFMFYIANPIFIVWFLQILKNILKNQLSIGRACICLSLIINLILLCMHKTFGGWQFGARYTLDLIPFSLLYILLSNRDKPTNYEIALCGFGLLFNAYGAALMRLSWSSLPIKK